MGYSIHVKDWDESWNYVGRDAMIGKKGEWSRDNEDGLNGDDEIPMMLYAYPLETEPSEEATIAVCEQTNCTVVEKDGDYFLALTGGGMDLSQDIAYAYLLAEGRIPVELCEAVITQPNFTKHGAKWLRLARAIKKELRGAELLYAHRRKKWNTAIHQFHNDRKVRRTTEAAKTR